jgi:hypothetical protein
MKKFYILIPMLLIVVSMACKSNKEAPQPDTSNKVNLPGSPQPGGSNHSGETTGLPLCSGTFQVLSGDSNLTVKNIKTTLLKSTAENNLKSRRMDFKAETDKGTFILSVTAWDLQNPPTEGILTKKYFSATNRDCRLFSSENYCDYMTATFVKGKEVYMSSAENYDNYILINKIIDKSVSGNFNVWVKRSDEQDSIKFSGSFSDQCYNIYY